jgi:LysM repeat protein
MKEQHQTIDRAGFGRIKKVLMTSINARKGEDLNKYAKIVGSVQYDGKDCYKIEINDPEYKIINYTVKAGQTTVWKVGDALAVPEYRIKELNDIDDDLKVGQVIKIPSSYAKKTTIYLDKATNLPLYQKMEDDKGTYEIYEMKNLKINVPLTDADFTL